MNRDTPVVHFELFRYQLLPMTQHVQLDMYKDILSVEELKKRKNEFLEKILSEFPPLTYRQAPLNHKVDMHKNHWFVVELNTQKTLQRDKKEFVKEKIDTWPHVVVIINNHPDAQLLAISRNRKAFASGAVVTKILQENLQKHLGTYLLNIQIEAIFEKNQFWSLIKQYDGKVTSVNFELISPNMANISKALQLDLSQLNVDTNSHKTNLKLNSGEGSVLEINQKNKLVNSLVDYSSQGGGDIELRIKGMKKTIKTSKSVREVVIDEITVNNLTPEKLELFLGKLQ